MYTSRDSLLFSHSTGSSLTNIPLSSPTFSYAASYPSGFMEGRRWIRVSVTSRTTRWLPFLYSLHKYCMRLRTSSRPRASFPCIPAT
ncbi:hypothetical protein EYF80_038727 [Liparis tanakae]|uniref:Uncharacterized protein n=1 Tax=Liparis tanakae TaxID=230148 RepID=A0A4Z2GCZ4_9TELE|nr:hypothetical protein EYF80_038727 [Liparis tanakae]